jgi:hypothetical protein
LWNILLKNCEKTFWSIKSYFYENVRFPFTFNEKVWKIDVVYVYKALSFLFFIQLSFNIILFIMFCDKLSVISWRRFPEEDFPNSSAKVSPLLFVIFLLVGWWEKIANSDILKQQGSINGQPCLQYRWTSLYARDRDQKNWLRYKKIKDTYKLMDRFLEKGQFLIAYMQNHR